MYRVFMSELMIISRMRFIVGQHLYLRDWLAGWILKSEKKKKSCQKPD